MYEIFVEDTFDAAHCIRGYKGSCNRLHGHTYKVGVKFKIEELDEIGMAVDFKLVKTSIDEIKQYLDHNFINDLPEFKQINPTAENIAKLFYERIKKSFPNLYSVSIWETPTSRATYYE
jgi:6-pyruvoyltetrahydropterin/6-carboxytetrahydropterin synthase